MDVTSVRTRFYNQFYHDYLSDPQSVTPFLPDYRTFNWLESAKRLAVVSETHAQVIKLLLEQNSDQQGDRAHRHLEQLKHPGCVMVVTGQQLGLLASPLYTIYKSLTTVKLTEQLNRTFPGINFIPVFWLESEDHDYDEVNHFGIWDNEFNPRQLVYGGGERKKVSLRHYRLGTEITELLEQLRSSLLQTEFSSDLFSVISEIYKPGQNWVEATRLFLKYIFRDTGLLFFQPGEPEIKNLSSRFFNLVLEKSSELSEIFAASSQQLSTRGYGNQVPVIPGKTFIHFENESGEREHLYSDSKGFYLKDSARRFSAKQVTKYLTRNPGRVSSSVVSRPLLQSWLLPVVAYVAGPAEVAYWAQLGNLFNCMDLQMPVVYPRITATLIEPKIARFIQKHQPDIENIEMRKEDFLFTYFKTRMKAGESDPVENLKVLLAGKFEEIRQHVLNLDPTLLGTGDKIFQKITDLIDLFQDKIIKTREQRESQLTSHLTQIHQAIFPDQQPQERYISIIYFLNKFGPAATGNISSSLQVGTLHHQVVYL
jgi:bacillithiol biosynthesis cysteine-adding enzyme BshC